MAAHRVLVADDDPGMAFTLRDVLEASGYAVEVAVSGRDAIERTRSFRPAVILMDIRMPGMDGVQAFRFIKQGHPEIPVIFITGYSESTKVDEAREEGALEVLPKPLDLDRLLRLLRETLAAENDAEERAASD